MRLFKYSLLLLYFAFTFHTANCANVKVRGSIITVSDGEPLRAVTVRVKGTNHGTYSNATGEFSLNVAKGSATLLFNLIGYEKDSVQLALNKDTSIVVQLKQSSVLTRELVVVAEDPGMRIMKRVIAKKEHDRDSIKNYSYMLYTKFVASTDTSTAGRKDSDQDTTIVGIIETYSKGYYGAPDSYFNEIIQRRQSANVPPQANFTVFGNNINVYDDFVKIVSSEIYTPFHSNAPDFYDFTLDTLSDEDRPHSVCRIIVQPQSVTRRLFTGVVHIDTTTCTPVDAELEPNNAVQLPFDAKLRYRQEFQNVKGYTMPKQLNIYSTLSADILWLIEPRLDLNIINYSWDYKINDTLPDDIFERRQVEAAESASQFDTTFWKKHNFIKLTEKEKLAYKNISLARENPDSVYGAGFLNSIFGPITRQIAKLNRKPFTGIDDIFIYNRVQGAALGFGIRDYITPDIEGTFRTGYGFQDKRPYGDGSLKYFFDKNHRMSATVRAFRFLERSDNDNIVRQSSITLLSIINKTDYGDYYYGTGFESNFEIGFGQLRFIKRDEFGRATKLKISFKSDREENAYVNAKFSIFNNAEDFRLNPPIIEGLMNTVSLQFNYNYNELRRLEDFGFFISGEFSKPELTGSDFDFSLFRFGFNFKTVTLPIWSLDFRVNGGIGVGSVPPQKFFSLESSFSGIAAQASFRGMQLKEFYGNRFITASVEHNFGELFPGLLTIPNIASFGIEFILFGNYGWSDFTSDARFAEINKVVHIPNSTAATRDNYYFEAGIGLAKLLFFLRLDMGARLTQTSTPQFFWAISFSGL